MQVTPPSGAAAWSRLPVPSEPEGAAPDGHRRPGRVAQRAASSRGLARLWLFKSSAGGAGGRSRQELGVTWAPRRVLSSGGSGAGAAAEAGGGAEGSHEEQGEAAEEPAGTDRVHAHAARHQDLREAECGGVASRAGKPVSRWGRHFLPVPAGSCRLLPVPAGIVLLLPGDVWSQPRFQRGGPTREKLGAFPVLVVSAITVAPGGFVVCLKLIFVVGSITEVPFLPIDPPTAPPRPSPPSGLCGGCAAMPPACAML